MANDNTNDVQAYGRPPEPSPELKDLDRLVGRWEVSGDYVEGTSTFEWMEGGFFLLQHVDFERRDGQRIKGVEIIGHERPFGAEPGEEIKSRFYSNTGDTLDYVYELEGAPSRSGAGRRAHQRITGAPLPPTATP